MTDDPLVRPDSDLTEYVRRIREQPTQKKVLAQHAPTAKETGRRTREMRARTLSLHDDSEGTAADLVQQRIAENSKFDRLVWGIARLMTQHAHDEAYQQRCRDAFMKRVADHDAKLRRLLGNWNPGKQLKHPN